MYISVVDGVKYYRRRKQHKMCNAYSMNLQDARPMQFVVWEHRKRRRDEFPFEANLYVVVFIVTIVNIL